MSGRSCNTRTQAVIPAGQPALGRLPGQGGAATHVHRCSSLPARLHLAGRHVREEPRHIYTGCHLCQPDHTRHVTMSRDEPQHTFTGGHPCWPDRTWQITMSGRSHNTDTHVANPVGQISLIKILQAHLSMQSSSKAL